MNGMKFFNDKNLVHYEGELGVFDYDPREFEIKEFYDGTKCLRYCGNGKSVDLPDGCIDTSCMFSDCKLPEGFSLGKHFNTSKVTSMRGMFCECELPRDFSLGEHFNTSKVVDMSSMFGECKLPKGFSLGKYFDTSNVTDMSYMFAQCTLSGGFSLGEHFDTSNVAYMCHMFYGCELPKGFSLGEYFNTSNITSMSDMFYGCELPEGFSLGEHFAIDRGTDVTRMFDNCKYKGVDAYDYFETQDAEEIITKLRKYKKSEDIVVDNELTALMLSVSEELQISTSAVQRMMKSYLKSLVNK